MIDVVIADDHPLFRRGVKYILQREPDFCPPGEAGNAIQLMLKIEEKRWDAVVLDISMPGRSGIEALSEIKKQRPNLPVLILSMHSEKQFAVLAIKAGASGFLTKSDVPEELVRAIRKILTGKKYFSPALAEVLVNVIESGGPKTLHDALSVREYLAVCAIASGKSVSQIAEEMALSVKTVSTYRARALEKMSMKTNAELTRYAIRSGLVD